MKAVLILVLLCISVVVADDKPYKGPSEVDVIELTPQNFEDTIYTSEDTWIVDLYAPWCGHCTTLRPEWAKFATAMQGRAKVAKIDPSDNAHRPQFFKLYGLQGFPRIIIIPAGAKDLKVYQVYEGARTASALEQWAVERMKAHKGYLVERLDSAQKWQQNCVDVGASLCVLVILPTLLDSTIEQRNVYLESVRSAVNNFRQKPVSFLWAQGGDHQEFEEQFNLRSGFPVTILINPGRRIFTIMKSSLTEQNLVAFLQQILRLKGGRRFGRYNKDLVFRTVSESGEASIEQQNIEVQQKFGEEL